MPIPTADAEPVQAGYPDIQFVIKTRIEDRLPALAGHVFAVRWPTIGIQEKLPLVRVVKTPGGRRSATYDYSLVNVDTLAATYADAQRLAEQIDAALIERPAFIAANVVVKHTESIVAPVELPWDDSNLRRFLGTYLFGVRR
jgi:hypothetical protein